MHSGKGETPYVIHSFIHSIRNMADNTSDHDFCHLWCIRSAQILVLFSWHFLRSLRYFSLGFPLFLFPWDFPVWSTPVSEYLKWNQKKRKSRFENKKRWTALVCSRIPPFWCLHFHCYNRSKTGASTREADRDLWFSFTQFASSEAHGATLVACI